MYWIQQSELLTRIYTPNYSREFTKKQSFHELFLETTHPEKQRKMATSDTNSTASVVPRATKQRATK